MIVYFSTGSSLKITKHNYTKTEKEEHLHVICNTVHFYYVKIIL